MVHNIHERLVAAPVEEVGPLLDRVGGPRDVLWPTPEWEPMVLDRPVAVGAAGGHGPIRYRVTAHEPGRRVEFTFEPGLGLHGRHTFTAEPAGPRSTLLRHVVEGRLSGPMVLAWPLAVRWVHDAVLEDLLDNAERAVGHRPARPVRWSPWVRLLRGLDAARSRAVPVPAHGPARRRTAARRLGGRVCRPAQAGHPGRPTGMGRRRVPHAAGVGRGRSRRAGGARRARRDRPGRALVVRHHGAAARRGAARRRRAPPRLPRVGARRAAPGRAEHRGAGAQRARAGLLRDRAARAPGDRQGDARPGRAAAVAFVRSRTRHARTR